jgi:PAS domain S-box-containing protein
MALTNDDTQRDARAALLDSQRRVLERIAVGAPLDEVLLTLVRLVEDQAGGMRCAVLLADSRRERLSFAAATDLPEDYKIAIQPFLGIGAGNASCGTAAYLRRPVYVKNTATDPLWKHCREIAVRNGLRAVWSTPILSDDSSVLGTFAMYYGEPRLPSPEHVRLIDMATQMARVAIEARHGDDMLRTIFDSAPGGIGITDLEGKIVRANPALERMVGYSEAELRGKSIAEVTHVEDFRFSGPLLADVISGKLERFSIDKRYRRKDGTLVWVHCTVALLRGPEGGPRYIISLMEDISERKRAEQELLDSRALLSAAPRIARLGIWQADLETGAVTWSEELHQMTGVGARASDLSYEDAMRTIHPDDSAQVHRFMQQALRTGEPYTIEHRMVRPDQAVWYARSIGQVVKDANGRPVKLLGYTLDITEQKHADDALRASAVELQALTRRLVELQESERRELARELHDRVGQNLTALGINLCILGESVAKGDTEAHLRLADSTALIKSTMRSIENVTTELRPPMLDDYGLAEALSWYVREFSARTSIEVQISGGEAAGRVSPEAEIAFFRIAQEALNNVAKHAKATRVAIALQRRDDEYLMTIEDDGVGVDARTDGAVRRRGLGMVTMRERAQTLGGSFAVTALQSGGTKISVRAPPA